MTDLFARLRCWWLRGAEDEGGVNVPLYDDERLTGADLL